MTDQNGDQVRSTPDYASAPRLLWRYLGGRGPLLVLCLKTSVTLLYQHIGNTSGGLDGNTSCSISE